MKTPARIVATEPASDGGALPFFIPLLKIDVATREVYGAAALEAIDDAKERCDVLRSIPHFEALALRCMAESGGRKVAPLREMHGLSAAGNVVEFVIDRVNRRIEARSKVTDNAAFQKVLDGTYCGYSMGGKKKMLGYDPASPGVRLYEAIPTEISLVDLGCIPGTGITMLNATTCEVTREDGTVATQARAYPQSVNTATVLARLAKDIVGDPTPGFALVADLATIVGALQYLLDRAVCEESSEGDASPLPGALADAIQGLGRVLAAMTVEEVIELPGAADVQPEGVEPAESTPMAAAALAKATPLRGTRKHVQLMHDLAAAMGAACATHGNDAAGTLAAMIDTTTASPVAMEAASGGEDDEMDAGERTKAVRGALGLADDATFETAIGTIVETKLEKAVGLIEKTATTVASLEERLAAAEAQLMKVSAMPMLPKGIVAVPDDGTKHVAQRDEPMDLTKASTIEHLKHIHQTGGRMVTLAGVVPGTTAVGF